MISLSRPVGEEVRLGLRRLVLAGAFSPGERLPDIGSLSVALAVNCNTIRRSCAALAEEGLLRQEGEGYTVSQSGLQRQAALERFDSAAQELLRLGVSPETLEELSAQAAARFSGTEEGGEA